MHPFEHVSAKDPTAERFAAILEPGVVFHSPVFTRPITGRDLVAELLETVHGIFGTPAYWLSLSEGSDTVLLFDGEVEGQTLQVAVVIKDGPEGSIQELTVLMRPLPVVRHFGEEGMARLGLSEADDSPPTGRPSP
jgi:hypothetical protein